MANTLYRIVPTMRIEEPELSGAVCILANGGTLFAELHPVRIKAKKTEPCEHCRTPPVVLQGIDGMYNVTDPVRARYCWHCGRKLLEE